MSKYRNRRRANFSAKSSVSEPSDTVSDSDYSISSSQASGRLKTLKQLWSLKGLSHQIKLLITDLKKTTYKQLAQILVSKLETELQALQLGERRREIQNLKRRVYDAINVMVAMQVLKKEKKAISVVESQLHQLEYPQITLTHKTELIKLKRRKLNQMTEQFASKQLLIERNRLNYQEFRREQTKPLPVLGLSVSLTDNLLLLSHRKHVELLVRSQQPITVIREQQMLTQLQIY